MGAGPPLQRRERHVAPSERRDVAELVSAERLLLVVSGADEAAVDFLVRLLAGPAVVLVGHPGPPLIRALVDGKALRPAGVELEAHIGDVEGLPCRDRRSHVKLSHPAFEILNRSSVTSNRA